MISQTKDITKVKSKIKRNYVSEKPLTRLKYSWYIWNLHAISGTISVLDWIRKKLRKRLDTIGSKHFGSSDLFQSQKN